MKGRILIVEDESIVQLDLQRRLERLGYTVVAVTARGEEAISQAALLRPDLVLMDVHLTGQMNGIEAARRIRAQGTPVVYLTAYASILRDADGGEVDGPYLSKPFGTQELNSTIVRTLGTSPPPAVAKQA